MDPPTQAQLRTAARACSIFAYAAGLAGIAGGTLLLREGSTVLAVVVWLTTFAVGATLMGVSLLVRALAGLLARLTRMETRLQVLTDRHDDVGPPDVRRDPWLRH